MTKSEALIKFWIKTKLGGLSVYIVQQKRKILCVVILRPYVSMPFF